MSRNAPVRRGEGVELLGDLRQADSVNRFALKRGDVVAARRIGRGVGGGSAKHDGLAAGRRDQRGDTTVGADRRMGAPRQKNEIACRRLTRDVARARYDKLNFVGQGRSRLKADQYRRQRSFGVPFGGGDHGGELKAAPGATIDRDQGIGFGHFEWRAIGFDRSRHPAEIGARDIDDSRGNQLAREAIDEMHPGIDDPGIGRVDPGQRRRMLGRRPPAMHQPKEKPRARDVAEIVDMLIRVLAKCAAKVQEGAPAPPWRARIDQHLVEERHCLGELGGVTACQRDNVCRRMRAPHGRRSAAGMDQSAKSRPDNDEDMLGHDGDEPSNSR